MLPFLFVGQKTPKTLVQKLNRETFSAALLFLFFHRHRGEIRVEMKDPL